MPEPIILTENLTKRFGALAAVERLNLAVAPGEVVGLLGPDGAGKTTTLRMMCGLVDPTEGTVRMAGYDVSRHINEVRDRIGYMAQRFGLYGDLTVEENMFFYADLFGVSGKERDALMAKLLGMTRMEEFRQRPAAKLSGGMKQKLALGCTLLHHPRILFLDEPTNGVDPVSRRDFWAILYQLVKEGMTVLVSTAYLDEAERCDRVGLMDHGRLIASGTPAALKESLDTECLAVHCADQRSALVALRAQPGVLSADRAGAALHVFLAPGATTAEKLKGALQQECTIAPVTPSLEDVFIALIRKQEHA
jgi:ABC-2 type transport system ATP-binding protein